MVKKILSIALWVITAAAIVVLFIFARENYLNTPIKAVNLLPASDSGFVRRSVLQKEIESYCEEYGRTKKIGTVDMVKIQKSLDANPWIESGVSYIGLDGDLNVSFKEYEPQLRVFGKNGRSVYVTDEGIVVPSCSNYIPYVLIANGNLTLPDDTTTYTLCDTLDRDRNIINALYWHKAVKANPFIENCVGQLYCNNKNEFELTVKGLDARVIVGDTCLAADKLFRLETFIKQRIDRLETQNMKTINLKYKNQIVCTKR